MRLSCDVVVVGGGVAGVPAAVASARAGADTLLIEQRAGPGGAGVAGMHPQICGLYSNATVPADSLLNGGLVREVCERLHALAPDKRRVRMGKVDVLPYAAAHFQQVSADLLAAELRLRTIFGATVKHASLESGRIGLVAADGLEIVPRAVVDCSGTGVVIGAYPVLHEAAPAVSRQMAGYTVRIGGLAGEVDLLPIRVPYEARQGVETGVLDPRLRFSIFMPGDAPGEGLLRLNLPAPLPDPATASCDADALLAHLQACVPAFRTARREAAPSEIMEREGVRLKGLYTLTADDVLGARRFPDAAARCAWPIELWEPGRGPVYRYLEPGQFCEIPVRCLQSAAADNLFCAGRCISATREALGATRVMGCCMALGEAAGRAAAVYGLAHREGSVI